MTPAQKFPAHTRKKPKSQDASNLHDSDILATAVSRFLEESQNFHESAMKNHIIDLIEVETFVEVLCRCDPSQLPERLKDFHQVSMKHVQKMIAPPRTPQRRTG